LFTFLVQWIAGLEAERSAFAKAQQLMTKVDPSAACQGCAGSRAAMPRCCVRCHRLLCVTCSGGGHNEVCELTCCNVCMSAEFGSDDYLCSTEQSAKRRELVELGRQVIAEACREGTVVAANRGLSALKKYGEEMQTQVLPCSVKQLMQFAIWAVKKHVPPYDTSSVESMLSGISRWMEQCKRATMLLHLPNPTKAAEVRELLLSLAKVYKKPSSAKHPFTPQEFQSILYHGFDKIKLVGRHNQVLFLLLGAGPLRPKVACNITVSYSVLQSDEGFLRQVLRFNADSQIWIDEHLDAVVVSISKDKNVTAKNRRNVYIPNSFMGVKVVEVLKAYILDLRMPSGSYLLASPKSPSTHVANLSFLPAGVYRETAGGGRFFNDNPYTASVDAVRRSAKNALPYLSELELKRYGGGSPRKSMAEMLWAAGEQKRTIQDLGGWAVSKRDAVDSYFSTKPHQRLRILAGLQARLERKGELAKGTVLLGGRAERGRRGTTWTEFVIDDSDSDDDC
jgi:hypothetical protein